VVFCFSRNIHGTGADSADIAHGEAGMIAFVCGLLLLAGGYVFYGWLTSSTVRPDPARITPAIARADGVDYVAMSTWRVYLVQLLNIAGLGPVFGPILGAL